MTVRGQQSVRRAVDVLLCFDAATPSLRVLDVAHRLGLNRTTTWRYLRTLADAGLVTELAEGRFGLGPGVLGLAEVYTSQWGELEAVAGAALVRLRDVVEETAALHVRQGWARVVVRQVESRHELHRTYRELGRPLPLTSGAPSLAILAALDRRERRAYLDAHPPGEHRRVVDEAVAQYAEHGYTSTHGSRVPGVASVASAVRDPAGRVIAAVNVTGPEDRLPASRTAEIAEHVVAAARWMERRLAGPAP